MFPTEEAQAEFENLVRNSDEAQLEVLLRTIQRRLGTADEQPLDFVRARMVAHELNNQITLTRLRAELQGRLRTTGSISAATA